MEGKKEYCTIYLVRHGQTDWNVKHLVQGHTNIPLNSTGELQAKQVAKELAGIHFSAIYSSDLVRSVRTAEIIALDRKIAVQTTQLLRERTYGSLEGRPREELHQRENMIESLSEKERFSLKYNDGMESDEDVMSRFITFIREIAVAYPGKTVLVVAHGGMMRALLLHLGFFTYKNWTLGAIANTAYIKLKTDGVDFFIEETKGIKKPD